MRLASHVWVSLLVRRVQSEGGFATVLRKGEWTAGSVFIVERTEGNTESLYSPAPTSAILDDPLVDRDNRIYEKVLNKQGPAVIAKRLAGEASFDPDHWVVELDGVDAQQFLDVIADEA